MLGKVKEVHNYGTRAASRGIHIASRDHKSVGYRIPKEWEATPVNIRECGSIGSLKRSSKGVILSGYAQFRCEERGCYVCNEERALRGRNVDERLV